MSRADNQLIITRHSCKVKDFNIMTILSRRTQLIPMIADQITHKQERLASGVVGFYDRLLFYTAK